MRGEDGERRRRRRKSDGVCRGGREGEEVHTAGRWIEQKKGEEENNQSRKDENHDDTN